MHFLTECMIKAILLHTSTDVVSLKIARQLITIKFIPSLQAGCLTFINVIIP